MMTTKTLFALVAIGLVAGTVSTGCESTPEKKIEDAKENLREAKHDVKEAVKDALTAYRDEWEGFKFDAETKLRENEYTMNEYKRKMVKADATQKAILNRKIEELGQRNAELQRRLGEYHDEGKTKWEEFKLEFTHDMDALGNSLKDLTTEDR